MATKTAKKKTSPKTPAKRTAAKPRKAKPKQAAQSLSVLLRVHNQVHTLTGFIERVLSAPLDVTPEIVIVDDGSTDGTHELIQELAKTRPTIRIIRHNHTIGQAKSLLAASKTMTSELAVILDADAGFNSMDLPRLLKPVTEDVADAALGSRFLSRDCRQVSGYRRKLFARLTTKVSNFINGIDQTDIQPHGILIRKEILEKIPLTQTGQEIATELVTKLSKWNLRMVEVAVTQDTRIESVGSQFGISDFFRTVKTVLKYRYFDRQFTLHDGFNILVSVGSAPKFNRWLVSKISPYFGKRILEAGSGIGNLTELFSHKDRLACVDFDPLYVERLRQRFGHMDNMSFHEFDLNKLGTCKELKTAHLDTIVCVNVLEHIEDDRRVLKSFAKLLEPGGQVVLLVPANPDLYTNVDRTLGHFRRYAFEEATAKMEEAGLDVVHCSGFNRLGAIGWYVSGKLLKRSTLSSRQMKLYEWLLPVAKLIERLTFLPQLSVIVVGRKPLPKRTKQA